MEILENEFLQIKISHIGAELQSIRSKTTGFEFLWQGNPEIWGRKSPVLFPIVGRCKNDIIQIEGKHYTLKQHGFARDAAFNLIFHSEDKAIYSLCSNNQYKQIYPFDFELQIIYELNGSELKTVYNIVNLTDKAIHYSIGAHPGFNLPGADMSNYMIRFEKTETLSRHFLKDGLFTGENLMLVNQSNELSLDSSLFHLDAIVFKNMKSNWIELLEKSGRQVLRMQYQNMPYLGIWSKAYCEDYICLEPWHGLADKENENISFPDKEGVLRLEPIETKEHSWAIALNTMFS
jgi:galactose mutarotase-like enzyme